MTVCSDAASNREAIAEIEQWCAANNCLRFNEPNLQTQRLDDGRVGRVGRCYRMYRGEAAEYWP